MLRIIGWQAFQSQPSSVMGVSRTRPTLLTMTWRRQRFALQSVKLTLLPALRPSAWNLTCDRPAVVETVIAAGIISPVFLSAIADGAGVPNSTAHPVDQSLPSAQEYVSRLGHTTVVRLWLMAAYRAACMPRAMLLAAVTSRCRCTMFWIAGAAVAAAIHSMVSAHISSTSVSPLALRWVEGFMRWRSASDYKQPRRLGMATQPELY